MSDTLALSVMLFWEITLSKAQLTTQQAVVFLPSSVYIPYIRYDKLSDISSIGEESRASSSFTNKTLMATQCLDWLGLCLKWHRLACDGCYYSIENSLHKHHNTQQLGYVRSSISACLGFPNHGFPMTPYRIAESVIIRCSGILWLKCTATLDVPFQATSASLCKWNSCAINRQQAWKRCVQICC